MPVIVSELEQQQSLERQTAMCKAMLSLPSTDGIGVALSYLLYASYSHPEVLRKVLNEQVVREGFRGESMITTLNRVARS